MVRAVHADDSAAPRGGAGDAPTALDDASFSPWSASRPPNSMHPRKFRSRPCRAGRAPPATDGFAPSTSRPHSPCSTPPRRRRRTRSGEPGPERERDADAVEERVSDRPWIAHTTRGNAGSHGRSSNVSTSAGTASAAARPSRAAATRARPPGLPSLYSAASGPPDRTSFTLRARRKERHVRRELEHHVERPAERRERRPGARHVDEPLAEDGRFAGHRPELSTTATPASRCVRPSPTASAVTRIPGTRRPAPPTFQRGSTMSRTLMMRTDSPGFITCTRRRRSMGPPGRAPELFGIHREGMAARLGPVRARVADVNGADFEPHRFPPRVLHPSSTTSTPRRPGRGEAERASGQNAPPLSDALCPPSTGQCPTPRSRGSSARRSASPDRFAPSTVTHNREPGRGGEPPRARDVVAALAHHPAPARRGRLDAEPEEGERRLDDDRARPAGSSTRRSRVRRRWARCDERRSARHPHRACARPRRTRAPWR